MSETASTKLHHTVIDSDQIAHVNRTLAQLRAENARLREALAKVQPLADAAVAYIKAADDENALTHEWRAARNNLQDAAADYARALANETTTAV